MNKEEKFIKIKEQIDAIYDKGTKPAPEYYTKILIDIMRYGGLEDPDIKRFFKYISNDLDTILKR